MKSKSEHITDISSLARDKHFSCSWTLQDAKKLYKYQDMINALKLDPKNYPTLQKHYDAFFELIEKRHNDHRNFVLEVNGHDYIKLSPVNNPSFEEDLPTIKGLAKLLSNYAQLETTLFRYIGIGTGTNKPTVLQEKLTTEIGSRYDASTLGFHDVRGVTLRGLATAHESTATITAGTEAGAFDISTVNQGTMLYRHVFTGDGIIQHTVNADTFSVGFVFELIPVGD